MEIRQARQNDAKDLATIREKAIKAGATSDYTTEEVQKMAESSPEDLEIEAPDHAYYVAEEEQIIGWAAVHDCNHRIESLYVRPGRMEEGAGSKLLDRIEDHARRKGYGDLVVHSSLNAEGFYRRKGYSPEERTETRGEHGFEVVRMRKELED